MTTKSATTGAAHPTNTRGRRAITLVLSTLLATWIALAVIAFASALQQRHLIHRVETKPWTVSMSDIRADDARVDLVNAIGLALFICTAAAFITWTFVEYRRLDGTRVDKRYGNGWAIGGWFVPIANWFIPYRVMADIWAGSVHRLGGRESPSTNGQAMRGVGVVRMWWGLWLASAVLARTSTGAADSPSEWMSANTMVLVRNSLVLAAAVVALVIVRNVARVASPE
jgi:hypothetical protein